MSHPKGNKVIEFQHPTLRVGTIVRVDTGVYRISGVNRYEEEHSGLLEIRYDVRITAHSDADATELTIPLQQDKFATAGQTYFITGVAPAFGAIDVIELSCVLLGEPRSVTP